MFKYYLSSYRKTKSSYEAMEIENNILRSIGDPENPKDRSFVMQPKLDGFCIILHYDRGVLVDAETRKGNVNFYEKALLIENLPQEIKDKRELYIVGELVLQNYGFNRYKHKYSSHLPVLRAFLNGKKQEYLDISKDLEFKAFDVLNYKDHKKLKKFKSVLDIMKFLKKQKFETVDTKEDVNIEDEIFDEPFRSKYDYPTDGIVFRLKSLTNRVKYNPELIGDKNPTSSFHTFAFKWKD